MSPFFITCQWRHTTTRCWGSDSANCFRGSLGGFTCWSEGGVLRSTPFIGGLISVVGWVTATMTLAHPFRIYVLRCSSSFPVDAITLLRGVALQFVKAVAIYAQVTLMVGLFATTKGMSGWVQCKQTRRKITLITYYVSVI